MHNDDALYQAMVTRDYRFDGKFFVGVKTTGIYCRPICRVRTPLRKNVEFFPTAAAAERAGYRPCLRCHPEAAPGSPTWHAQSVIVQRALKRIAANELAHTNESDFAAHFGITPRHLRRLFIAELGQTPKQLADAYRLNFARKLVTETPMPLTTVAHTAGFSSLRRFNAAFKTRFHRPPSRFRKLRPDLPEGAIDLTLPYRPPYDWNAIHAFYAAHIIPGLERAPTTHYERLCSINGIIALLQLRPHETLPALQLRVFTADPTILFDITHRLRRMFDLDADPLLIANAFATQPLLHSLIEKHPGLRLPRGFDPFETAVCAILGQLVSLDYARTLAGQLVQHYGQPATHPLTGQPVRLFPVAKSLATADLAHVKTTRARKQAIRLLSQRLVAGTLSLSDAQDPAAFRAALLDISGIGPWTAEYIALRCIADTDAFPATDLILRRALDLHPTLDLASIKPWRAYAAIHLWKEYAASLSRKRTRARPPNTIRVAATARL
jgi:AraC family transcriptional regulator of adaptative response / DNA-3-methyladenine glycosylase II